MRNLFALFLAVCAVASFGSAKASQLENNPTTCAASPYAYQGNPAACPGITLPTPSSCGSYAFPGLSTTPIEAYGDCVFIDNVGGDCNAIPFIPLGKQSDWQAFKNAAGSNSVGKVRLNNFCRSSSFVDEVCGSVPTSSQLPPPTRNGEPHTFTIGDRTEVWTCTAGPGCSASWTRTDFSGTCPNVLAGACGAAANPANRYTAEPSDAEKCASGTPNNENGNGPWSWVCESSNGGEPSPPCTALGPDGQCGPAKNTALTAPPDANAGCGNGGSIASEPSLQQDGSYAWTCAGKSGGNDSGECRSLKTSCDFDLCKVASTCNVNWGVKYFSVEPQDFGFTLHCDRDGVDDDSRGSVGGRSAKHVARNVECPGFVDFSETRFAADDPTYNEQRLRPFNLKYGCPEAYQDGVCNPNATAAVLTAAPSLSDACEVGSSFHDQPSLQANGSYIWTCRGVHGGDISPVCQSQPALQEICEYVSYTQSCSDEQASGPSGSEVPCTPQTEGNAYGVGGGQSCSGGGQTGYAWVGTIYECQCQVYETQQCGTGQEWCENMNKCVDARAGCESDSST